MKKLLPFFAIVIFIGCQNFRSRLDESTAEPTAPSAPNSTMDTGKTSAEIPPGPVEVATPPAPKANLKLGIILGAGSARSFAEIGFLKQLQTRRVPVHAIVGLEWGALVAASFAAKGSAHEAEWQLSKMKGLDQGWFSEGSADIRTALNPLQAYLSSYKAESLKIPFGCPSLNLKKSQVFMMARGRLDQLLPFCLAYPPSVNPHERTIAAVREINMAVEYLRSQGANYIVLVNVLGQLDQNEPVNWLELSYDMKRKWPGVHERLDLVMGSKRLGDFKARQEMIESGMEQSTSFVEKLSSKM